MKHVIQGTAINNFKGQGSQCLSFDNIRKGSLYQKTPLHENYTRNSVMQTSVVPIEGCTAALWLRSARAWTCHVQSKILVQQMLIFTIFPEHRVWSGTS